jgi:hypothetical protein
MKSPLGKSRGGTPEGERALQGANCTARYSGYGSASFGVPLSFSSSFMPWLEAQIVTAPAPPPVSSDEDRCGERNVSWLYLMRVTTTRMQVHRENDEACSHLRMTE